MQPAARADQGYREAPAFAMSEKTSYSINAKDIDPKVLKDVIKQVKAALSCPISQVLLEDPVLLLTCGHEYSKSMLERWYAFHPKICTICKKNGSLYFSDNAISKSADNILRHLKLIKSTLDENRKLNKSYDVTGLVIFAFQNQNAFILANCGHTISLKTLSTNLQERFDTTAPKDLSDKIVYCREPSCTRIALKALPHIALRSAATNIIRLYNTSQPKASEPAVLPSPAPSQDTQAKKERVNQLLKGLPEISDLNQLHKALSEIFENIELLSDDQLRSLLKPTKRLLLNLKNFTLENFPKEFLSKCLSILEKSDPSDQNLSDYLTIQDIYFKKCEESAEPFLPQEAKGRFDYFSHYLVFISRLLVSSVPVLREEGLNRFINFQDFLKNRLQEKNDPILGLTNPRILPYLQPHFVVFIHNWFQVIQNTGIKIDFNRYDYLIKYCNIVLYENKKHSSNVNQSENGIFLNILFNAIKIAKFDKYNKPKDLSDYIQFILFNLTEFAPHVYSNFSNDHDFDHYISLCNEIKKFILENIESLEEDQASLAVERLLICVNKTDKYFNIEQEEKDKRNVILWDTMQTLLHSSKPHLVSKGRRLLERYSSL